VVVVPTECPCLVGAYYLNRMGCWPLGGNEHICSCAWDGFAAQGEQPPS